MGITTEHILREEGKKMANLTRHNIAYDLTISPHKMDVVYPEGVITFVFSSDLYRQKFADKLEENRANINASLSNRFNFKIENNVLCDIKLYTVIEKRGFLLHKDGRRLQCQNEIILTGSILS